MKMSDPVVYIIDDDDIVRKYFDAVISSANLACVGLESAASFLELYNHEQPGCVVLDLQMPEMSGIELQLRLNTLGAMIPLLFVSAHADIPIAVQAMREGAFDFITKPVAGDLLISRVNDAITYDAENRAALQQRELAIQRFQTLTQREKDVLSLLMAGRSNKAMAGDLNLSQRTVELYRARIMEKTGSRSLAQLVRMAMDLKLAPQPPSGQSMN
jgi:two-component system, LuxR family, response regulator FixJ